MRNIGNKFLSALINSGFVFNVGLQLVVGGFKLCDRALQLLGQYIHRISERTDFILGISLVSCGKIKIGHLLG